jgi:hypothetical protein
MPENSAIVCRLAICMMVTAQAMAGSAPRDAELQLREYLATGTVAALSDEEPQVRSRALDRLGELGQLSTAEPIAEFLRGDHSETERSSALNAYASLHVPDPRHIAEILRYLSPPPEVHFVDPALARPATEALAAMGIAGSYHDLLHQLLECPTKGSVLQNNSSPLVPGDTTCALAASVIRGLAAGGSRPHRREDEVGPLADYKSEVTAFLSHSSDRSEVIHSLEVAGLAQAYLPQIRAILTDSPTHSTSRSDYLAALSAIVSIKKAPDYLPQIEWALKQPDFALEVGAIRAVEQSGLDQAYHSQFVLMLHSKMLFNRLAALNGIAAGSTPQNYATDIESALAQEIPTESMALHWYSSALQALAESSRPEFDALLAKALSTGASPFLAEAVFTGLYHAGTIARFHNQIRRLLMSDPPYPLRPLVWALRGRRCDLEEEYLLGGSLDSYLGDLTGYKLTIYSCSGGNSDARLLMAFFAARRQKPIDYPSSESQLRRAFKMFSGFASDRALSTGRREPAAAALMDLAPRINWQVGDLDGLRATRHSLARDFADSAAALDTVIDDVAGRTWSHRTLRWVGTPVAIYLATLLLFILVYPRLTPMMQNQFLENPAIYKILRLGLLEPALLSTPLLRRILMKPLNDLLLLSLLDGYEDRTYYDRSRAQETSTGETVLISQLSRSQKAGGVVVLEGEPFLGKTMYLRHLAFKSKKLTILLEASSCDEGVVAAIQDRLIGFTREPHFVNSLLHGGALQILIDRLDAASQETRTKVIDFARYCRDAKIPSEIVITTRPLEGMPPGIATHVLQPIDQSEIQEFLARRESLTETSLREARLNECLLYITQQRDAGQPREELAMKQRLLSNPKILDLLLEAINAGGQPDLMELATELQNSA